MLGISKISISPSKTISNESENAIPSLILDCMLGVDIFIFDLMSLIGSYLGPKTVLGQNDGAERIFRS